MEISLRNITKSFNNVPILKNINLHIKAGELVALIGPSGSGKTTLLRIIAGLDRQDSGNIIINDKFSDNKSPKERNVGFVFQNYALFKHMNVYENIAFGLRIKKKSQRLNEKEIDKRVKELLKFVHLEHISKHYPDQISGGQKQRIALARSLATEPQILLLDEPFGALDAKVRLELRQWLRKVHEQMKITTIFVTHDREEAMELADKIVVIGNGEIAQTGTAEQLYNQPKNSFVYDFLGNFNVFYGHRDSDGKLILVDIIYNKIIEEKPQKLVSRLINFFKPNSYSVTPKKPIRDDKEIIEIFVRPHELEITKIPEINKDYIKTSIISYNILGPNVKIELSKLDKSVIFAELSFEQFEKLEMIIGETFYVRPKNMIIFD